MQESVASEDSVKITKVPLEEAEAKKDVETEKKEEKEEECEVEAEVEAEEDREQMNGYSDTDDSDDEGQLRIAEEENFPSPEVRCHQCTVYFLPYVLIY